MTAHSFCGIAQPIIELVVPIFGTARVESQRSTLSTQPFQCWKTLVVTAVHRHLCVPVELHSFLSGIPSVSIGSSLDLVVLEVLVTQVQILGPASEFESVQ